jgi:hypothetical protein
VALERDTCANFWALTKHAGHVQLFVLPAQRPQTWQPFAPRGLPLDELTALRAEPDGTVTLIGRERAWAFDPRTPESAVVPVAVWREQQQPNSPWQIVARMPASNHDLSAAVLDANFYVAGGITSDWGFPALARAFDELWSFETGSNAWRVATRLSCARIYCATVSFGDEIWIVGGDVIDAGGQRHATTLVEHFDPKSRSLRTGPELAHRQPRPVALVARGRLYVIGAEEKETPGRMDSIGSGEASWRREPDGPPNMWALAGAALHEVLYLSVPRIGLVAFDPANGRWEIIGGPAQPRSPQVAAWHDELWIMGGRDTASPTAVHIFNPQSRTWRLGPALPRELAWGAAAVAGDRLFFTGGAAGPGFTDRTYELRTR